MHWIVRSLFVSLCLIHSVALAAPPKSENQDAAARRHFESGRDYFERAQYDEAAREFEEAHRLSGRNALLVNLSRAHESAGRPEAAADVLDRWFEKADADDPLRAEMETRRTRLRAEAERAAAASADEKPATPEPEAPAEAEPAEPAATPTHEQSALWPWVTISAGAALAAGGVVFFVLGRSDVDAVENPGPNTTWADIQEQHDRGPTRIGIGIGLGAVGLVAVGAGVTWLLMGRDSNEAHARLVVGADHLSVRGAF